MRHQQERNCQAEGQLPRFTCRHTQMPSAVKRVEPEKPVPEKGGIKHDQTGIGLPRREQHRARRLHGINGPDAKSVIDQVRCRKREQDQACRQANGTLEALSNFDCVASLRSAVNAHETKNRNACDD